MVSGIPCTAFGGKWFWRRGLRTCSALDTCPRYGGNAAHPPDAIVWHVGASDIADHRRIWQHRLDDWRVMEVAVG